MKRASHVVLGWGEELGGGNSLQTPLATELAEGNHHGGIGGLTIKEACVGISLEGKVAVFWGLQGNRMLSDISLFT